MKTLRPALVAACCLAWTVPASASTPDKLNVPITSPPHLTDDKSAAEATEMNAMLQRAKDAVNSAKKPEELDSTISDLQKYQSSPGPFGFAINPAVAPSNQPLLQQLLSALEFTRLWQNYLSHLDAGDTNQARNDLQMMSQNNSGPTLIPRSRILALLNGPQLPTSAANSDASISTGSSAQKIIDGINTLDDLSTALTKLDALGAQDALARQYVQQLGPMVEVYGDLKGGLPTSVDINFMGGLTGPGVSVKANSLLLKFILQHYFDTYRGAPPSEDETPASYAMRVKTDALTGQDWMLVKKALTVHAYLGRNVSAPGGNPDNESLWVDDLMTGLNQEAAGQYALAVETLQNVLKSGSLDVPAKYIGQRLDDIRHNHPSDYDAGVDAFLTVTASPMGYNFAMNPFLREAYGNLRRNSPTGFPGYPGMPGYAGTNRPNPPNPVLSIPASTPASTPATVSPAPAH